MNNKQSIVEKTTRLAAFEVDNLFNEIDYRIPLFTSERITAIIAPNGSGKTACLRLMNCLFRRRWSVYRETEFAEVRYSFTTGEKVAVTRKHVESDDESGIHLPLEFKIWTTSPHDDQDALFWAPKLENQRARLSQIERFLPFLTRVGLNKWTHDHTNQQYTVQEIIESYADQLPSNLLAGVYSDEPEELKSIIEAVDCHLIETQRLLILPSEDRSALRPWEGRKTSTLAIARKATVLKERIAEALTAYATLSQSLDRSFPQRVIETTKAVALDRLISDFSELDELRRNIVAAGLLGAEATSAVSMPSGDIAATVRRVLGVYVEDTRKKLNSFRPLLLKVRIFRDLIGQRFRNKSIEVDQNVGFKVSFRGREVPLEKLSSGEQHQLVLFFELLFELGKNALILIDEPELSLHVSWQRSFIHDINRIIGVSEFDAVLATHSPQLIAHWSNLVIDLGDVE